MTSAEHYVDAAFSTLLRKMQRDEREATKPLAQSASINFFFSGGGSALVAPGQPMMVEVMFPATILGCHVYAGDDALQPVTATATFDLQLGKQGFWAGGTTALHAGTLPSISGVEADVAMTGWITTLLAGDLVATRLVAFSGLATWMLVTLTLRRIDTADLGEFGVVDPAGDVVVDANGNPVVWRT